MSGLLSELIETINILLDKTIKTVTIPADVISMEIIPFDVDVHLAMTSGAFTLMSGAFYKGTTSRNVAILPYLSEVLCLESDDLANRTFKIASLASGSVSIVYKKTF